MRKAARYAAFFCAWLYTAAHFAASGIRQPIGNFYGDFLGSFPSWRLSVLLGRLDLYHGSLAEIWALKVSEGGPSWNYGPVLHLVTLPLFAFSDLRSAYTAWLIANYLFLVVILAFATSEFQSGRSRWVWGSLTAITVLNYGPLYEALTQRNIEIFELLLIFAAFALLQRRRSGAAGFTLGIAVMTKFLPLIFLPYFVVKQRFRALIASIIAIVPVAIATELVFGWRNSATFIQLRKGGLIVSELDQSLSSAILRVLGWTHSSLSPAVLSRVAIILALLGVSWLFLRARACRAIEDLEWSALIVAMVLLPPHNQQYYFVMLLFPYLALLAREVRPGAPAHHARRLWLAISFLLTGTVVPLSVLSKLSRTNVFEAYLALGIPFCGAAILAAICLRAILSECAAPRTAANDSGMPHAV